MTLTEVRQDAYRARVRRIDARPDPNPEWRLHAACATTQGDWYSSPEPGGAGSKTPPLNDAERAAIAVCNECPVRVRCLDYAMAANERYGIFGGFTPSQRQRLRRQRRVGA